MAQDLIRRRGRALEIGRLAVGLLLVVACAEGDRTGPSETTEFDTPAAAVTPAGIVFASFKLTPSQLNTVHTGIVGPSSPSALLSFLSSVRAKGGRVVLVLSSSAQVRNDDGTFDLTKWKTSVDRYRNVDFSSYITDGTIVAHFLIDEPHFPSRWGNKVIPQATVEAAAAHSKQRWPGLPTLVNAPAQWLAASTTTYTHLDAAWAMFRAGTASSPATWINGQVNKAKSKGLGLIAGLNVLDGGDGSSGFHGNYPSKWAMSASELRAYGSALLAQSYVCGFAMWQYKSSYYDRADIKSALADIAANAKSHTKTSCRQ